jgi:hypothetical protein
LIRFQNDDKNDSKNEQFTMSYHFSTVDI